MPATLAAGLKLTPSALAKRGIAINQDGVPRSALELLAYPGHRLGSAGWPVAGAWRDPPRISPSSCPSMPDTMAIWPGSARTSPPIAATRLWSCPADLDYRRRRQPLQRSSAKAEDPPSGDLGPGRPDLGCHAGRLGGAAEVRPPPRGLDGPLQWPGAVPAEMRELGVDVSRETLDQLEALVSTLVRWQKAINLVGRPPWRTSGPAMSSIRPSSALDPGRRHDARRPRQRRRDFRDWSWRRSAGPRRHPDRVRCPQGGIPGRGGPAHGPGQAAKGRGRPHRGRAAGTSRCRDRPGAWRRSANCSTWASRTGRIPLFAFSTRGKGGRPN